MKIFLTLLLFFSVASTHAAEVSRERVQEAMERATKFMTSISTEGGYLWSYSPDLTVRAGENMASPTQIWIQPPGTPSMGQAFLDAYKVTKNVVFLEAARRAAEALARCQLPSGGWYYAGDFNPEKPNIDGLRSHAGDQAAKGNSKVENPLYFLATAFDDNTTQSAVRFLLDYVDVSKSAAADPRDTPISESLLKGLRGMINAQYPNGAWPEFYDGKPRNAADFPVQPARIPADYPKVSPGGDYRAHYTLNDDSLKNCIQVMSEAYRRLGNPEYQKSAQRGIEFILLAQLPAPQPAWAQQYSFAMEPTWGRTFEPPSIVSNESRGMMELLMNAYLETGEGRYLDAVSRAVEWLRPLSVAPGLWSRFYELNTNRPIYCQADGVITFDRNKARPGYNWQNEFHLPKFFARYDEIKKLGREAYLASRPPASEPESAGALEKKAALILDQIDDKGRWIVKDRFRKNLPEEDLISTAAFIANMRVLGKYLELAQERPR